MISEEEGKLRLVPSSTRAMAVLKLLLTLVVYRYNNFSTCVAVRKKKATGSVLLLLLPVLAMMAVGVVSGFRCY